MLSRAGVASASGKTRPQKYEGKTFSELMVILAKIVVPKDSELMARELGKILSLKGLFEVRMAMREIEATAINAAMNAYAICPISSEAKVSDVAEMITIMRQYCLDWDALFVHPVVSIMGADLITRNASDAANAVMSKADFMQNRLFEAAKEFTIYRAEFAMLDVKIMFIDKSAVKYTFSKDETIKGVFRHIMSIRECVDGPVIKSVEVRPLCDQ